MGWKRLLYLSSVPRLLTIAQWAKVHSKTPLLMNLGP